MFITLETAKSHLRIDGADEDTILALYIGAAERAAVEYVERNIYADSTALNAAIAAAPAALTTATAANTAALAAADLIVGAVERAAAIKVANDNYAVAQTAHRMTQAGMVVNDLVKAAMLLTLGTLYAAREDVVIGASVSSLPSGACHLLQPFRVYGGV